MALYFTPSAARHGIPSEDALYAIAHAVGSEELGWQGKKKKKIYVGHPHGQTERFIEVIVLEWNPREIEVFHVMELSSLYEHLAFERPE